MISQAAPELLTELGNSNEPHCYVCSGCYPRPPSTYVRVLTLCGRYSSRRSCIDEYGTFCQDGHGVCPDCDAIRVCVNGHRQLLKD